MDKGPVLPPWIKDLPKVRGRYTYGVPLSKVTWFQVGGPVDVVFKPADANDLCTFLENKPDSIPCLPLGVGSNVLVRDGGIRGVIIRLGRAFTFIEPKPDHRLFVGAGALDVHVAQVACTQGTDGLAFLRGIPGTLGGALRMNAGAYGAEMKDILRQAQAVDPKGMLHTFAPQDLGFSYRRCGLPEGWIFVNALLQGRPGNRQEIQQQMDTIQHQRAHSQPIRTRTGGSTFANPPGHKAWQLIDQSGCRGLRLGGAQVSEQHCNFLLNTGNATAEDLETLGETVKKRVYACSGIDLEWEIRKLGKKIAPQSKGDPKNL